MMNITVVFGAACVTASIIFLAINKKQRDLFLDRLRRSSGRFSSTAKPPPSINEKQPPKQSTYHAILPPLRRESLPKNSKNAISGTERAIEVNAVDNISEETVKELILPMDVNYKTAAGNLFTPTGFSVDEITSLGDFPDYAKLSGIPLPDAYPEFDVDKALPRPYRPFRWNYHQTMSLTKLERNWWIELENTYRSRIKQRQELYAKHGKDVLDFLPGSELACKELMEVVLQYICARYPQYFRLSPDKTSFTNDILNSTITLRSQHPLKILMDHVPEDFVIMMRDEKTGLYVFRAGVICSSLGWNLGSKFGLQLHEIHGPVPDYKEKMQFSMDRFFSKMPTDKPIQRGSWGLEVGQPLFTPPGDPDELQRLSQDPSLPLDACHLRVDWQTLRRLPLSGAIVFNFKALFTPVTEFRDEPAVPALLAKILREGKRVLMDHKKVWHVQHVVLPALDQWAEEQVEDGLVERDWQVSTLDDSPLYKDWEEKWHRQQGF